MSKPSPAIHQLRNKYALINEIGSQHIAVIAVQNSIHNDTRLVAAVPNAVPKGLHSPEVCGNLLVLHQPCFTVASVSESETTLIQDTDQDDPTTRQGST